MCKYIFNNICLHIYLIYLINLQAFWTWKYKISKSNLGSVHYLARYVTLVESFTCFDVMAHTKTLHKP